MLLYFSKVAIPCYSSPGKLVGTTGAGGKKLLAKEQIVSGQGILAVGVGRGDLTGGNSRGFFSCK